MNNDQEMLMTDVDLPKVMIIGQTFTSDTGGGVTLTNLFKHWPKNKLAVAVESKEALDFSKSANYYRLGYQEQAMPFPFSLLQRKTPSGKVTESVTKGAVYVKETNHLKATLKRYFDDTLHHLGLYYWLYGNQKVSSEFIEWFNEFNPDVIYYQPNSYKSMGFASRLKRISKKPMIVHVMDDWFTFAVKPGPLMHYWQHKFDQKVRAVFSNADIHLSICQYMSDAYRHRYGHIFKPYHNSVNLDSWMNKHNLEVNPDEPFHLLYAGRIGYGVENTLMAVAKTVGRMAEKGWTMHFEIQTKDSRHLLVATLRNLKNVTVSETIPYAKLPEKLASADALLIPCDFDEMGLKFIKYSMPTKVSEYMAVGTPVFVVGPPDTALVEYAKEGWAHVCTSMSRNDIETALFELASSEALRSKLVEKAHILVKQNHDEKEVTRQFSALMTLAAWPDSAKNTLVNT
jgi:glycosyltransferase involved in cell wall biosynthesis